MKNNNYIPDEDYTSQGGAPEPLRTGLEQVGEENDARGHYYDDHNYFPSERRHDDLPGLLRQHQGPAEPTARRQAACFDVLRSFALATAPLLPRAAPVAAPRRLPLPPSRAPR